MPRLLRAFIQNFQYALGMLFEFNSSRAHRLNPLDQMIRHLAFALDAANPRRAAAGRSPLQSLEDLLQVTSHSIFLAAGVKRAKVQVL